MDTPSNSFRKYLLVVTGSIAAINIPLFITNLIRTRSDIEIRVLVSMQAKSFFVPEVLKVDGVSLFVDSWEACEGRSIHVEFSEWADGILVFPASVHLFSRLANGITNTPSIMTIMLANCPVVLAPSLPPHVLNSTLFMDNWNKILLNTKYSIAPIYPGWSRSSDANGWGADFETAWELLNKKIENDPIHKVHKFNSQCTNLLTTTIQSDNEGNFFWIRSLKNTYYSLFSFLPPYFLNTDSKGVFVLGKGDSSHRFYKVAGNMNVGTELIQKMDVDANAFSLLGESLQELHSLKLRSDISFQIPRIWTQFYDWITGESPYAPLQISYHYLYQILGENTMNHIALFLRKLLTKNESVQLHGSPGMHNMIYTGNRLQILTGEDLGVGACELDILYPLGHIAELALRGIIPQSLAQSYTNAFYRGYGKEFEHQYTDLIAIQILNHLAVQLLHWGIQENDLIQKTNLVRMILS